MKQAAGFFNQILARILTSLGLRPLADEKKTPEMLDKQVLAQVFSEARFLQDVFHVQVRELEPGEEAGPPRPAGDFDVPAGVTVPAPQAEQEPAPEPLAGSVRQTGPE